MKDSTNTIRERIHKLYAEVDATQDPDTIREKGKEIIGLESKLQKRKKQKSK